MGLNDGREGHPNRPPQPRRKPYGENRRLVEQASAADGRVAEGGVAGEGSARAPTTRRRAAEPADASLAVSADRAAPKTGTKNTKS